MTKQYDNDFLNGFFGELEIEKYFFTSYALYHYTKLNTSLEKILPTMEIKLSTFRGVNDPCEYN